MIEETLVFPCVFLSFFSVGNIFPQPLDGFLPKINSEYIFGVQDSGTGTDVSIGNRSILVVEFDYSTVGVVVLGGDLIV